jgi:hypothetical protein
MKVIKPGQSAAMLEVETFDSTSIRGEERGRKGQAFDSRQSCTDALPP